MQERSCVRQNSSPSTAPLPKWAELMHDARADVANRGGKMQVLLCWSLALAAIVQPPQVVGKIVDDRGNAISGVSISAVALPSSQVTEETISGNDGSFHFVHLHYGSYGVEAKTESACAFSDAIQINSGFTSIVQLRLVKGLCSDPIALQNPRILP